MRAVVFGTGRIACGVVGELLRDAGWNVMFVGRNRAVVDNLAANGRYRLRLSSGAGACERTISGVDALVIDDRRDVVGAVAAADLVVTAVGVSNLAAVAPVLADGLAARDTAVDVIACENHDDAGGLVQQLVLANAAEQAALEIHGFAGGLVSRAVASRIGDPRAAEPLTFVGEPIRELIVDGAVLRRPTPVVDGLRVVSDFAAYVQRKLFVFSAGHATAAYLGQVKGYRFVHAAVRDPEIAAAVMEAMREGQYGIAARYGTSFARFDGPPRRARRAGQCEARHDRRAEAALDTIFARFANASLCDPVARVGRDPRRKLNRSDRLLGAAQLARDAGVDPSGLVMAAAAALCFECADDPGAEAMRAGVSSRGVTATLARECGIGPRSALADAVLEAWNRLTGGGWISGNALLSIDHPQWAWQG